MQPRVRMERRRVGAAEMIASAAEVMVEPVVQTSSRRRI